MSEHKILKFDPILNKPQERKTMTNKLTPEKLAEIRAELEATRNEVGGLGTACGARWAFHYGPDLLAHIDALEADLQAERARAERAEKDLSQCREGTQLFESRLYDIMDAIGLSRIFASDEPGRRAAQILAAERDKAESFRLGAIAAKQAANMLTDECKRLEAELAANKEALALARRALQMMLDAYDHLRPILLSDVRAVLAHPLVQAAVEEGKHDD